MARLHRNGLGLVVATGLAAGSLTAQAQTAAPSVLSPAPTAAIAVPAVPAVPPPAITPAAPAAAVPAPAPTTSISGTAAAAPGATTVAPAAPVPVVNTKPHKKPAPPAPPRETALSTDPTPTLTPDTFFATAKASERYAAIADAGGWPKIDAPLSPGAKGAAVATLRLRLAIEGYLAGHPGQPAPTAADSAAAFDTRWGPDLAAAIKRFQVQHGLKDTGSVTGATLKAINVPANVRFTELASSAQRLAGRQFNFADRYVVVNIPSAAVETVDHGQVFKRYVAVVGDPDHASPEVDAKVVAVNLNPTWTVPVSIIKNEIIPKMQKDPGYLAKEKIRILDNQGNTINPRSIDWTSQRAVNYTLRQDSGAGNALGAIRINMPNKFAVYMHDTPSKRFFGADMRFLSHGCVRVQGVYDLASWLLQGTPGSPDGLWTRDTLVASGEGGQPQEIRLTAPVPVTWVYLTGWANASGEVHFRDDVYGLDTIGAPAEARADLEALTKR